MQIKLVNHTPNPEAFVAYIARVSNSDNQSNPDYAKLIKYLLKNGHYSPFEHSYFTFKIVTSRAIAAQILRHRSFTFQEYSQRYSIAEAVEPVELRRQATKNRQSSEEVFNPALGYGSNGFPDLYASELVADVLYDIKDAYKRLIAAGVAKEVARMILPLTIQTTIYITGSIRSFIHYLALRTDHHTQKEHRLIANEIEAVLREHLPTVFAALDSIKADKKRDALLLKLLTEHQITDAQLLERLLFTNLEA